MIELSCAECGAPSGAPHRFGCRFGPSHPVVASRGLPGEVCPECDGWYGKHKVTCSKYLAPEFAGPATQRQVGGDHYTEMAIQPIEYIQRNKIPFIEGNIIKYVSRWREKGGREDLLKARHYIDLLVEFEDRDADSEA